MSLVTRRFITTGLHCPSCSMLVQMDVGDIPGVDSVACDHRTGITEVTFAEGTVSPEAVIAAITKAGYGAELAQD